MHGLTSKPSLTEREWQNKNAQRFGIRKSGIEVVLWEGSRVDWLDDEYAYEIDWAYKWKESIGQSIWYSIVTRKKPAVVLIYKNKDKDQEFMHKATAVCDRLGIYLILAPEVDPDGTERH